MSVTRWSYFVAEVERGSIFWEEDGRRHEQSLIGGLTFLGSQGWELRSSLPRHTLGTIVGHTLIFQKPAEIF